MAFEDEADNWKILFFFSIVVVTILFGFAPLFTFKRLQDGVRERVMGLSNAFAGF
jgi:hypothetical protein